MNAWVVTAIALVLATVPLSVVLVRSDTVSRLVALDVFGVMGTLTLLALAEGYDRSIYADLALVLGTLTTVTGLLYARMLERWL